jgi:dipeptidase
MNTIYVGTPLSLTEGMAAGPFGDPNRYTNHAYGTMTLRETLDGAFARPISLFRTSTSIVAQARNSVPNELGRVWVSAYAPDVSSYTPMYVSTTEISTHWSTGSMHIYDSNVAWWNFAVVGNYVARYYHFAIDSVRKLQSNLQSSFDEECVAIEKKVMKILESGDEDDKAKVTSMLTDFTVKKGDEVWDLLRVEIESILCFYCNLLSIGISCLERIFPLSFDHLSRWFHCDRERRNVRS